MVKRYTLYKVCLLLLALAALLRLASPASRLHHWFELAVVWTPFVLFAAFALVNRRRRSVLERDSVQAQLDASAERWAKTAARLAGIEPSGTARSQPKTQTHPLFHDWCRTAAGYVPRSRRSAVYAECYTHLLEHADALGGAPDADARAVAAMGDADLVGRQLRRVEWKPRAVAARLRRCFSGIRWVTYYRGSDEHRYARLRQALTASGIVCQFEEWDALSRSYAFSNTGAPGCHSLNPTCENSRVELQIGAAVTGTFRERPAQYLIRIRVRDLPAAKVLAHE